MQTQHQSTKSHKPKKHKHSCYEVVRSQRQCVCGYIFIYFRICYVPGVLYHVTSMSEVMINPTEGKKPNSYMIVITNKEPQFFFFTSYNLQLLQYKIRELAKGSCQKRSYELVQAIYHQIVTLPNHIIVINGNADSILVCNIP